MNIVKIKYSIMPNLKYYKQQKCGMLYENNTLPLKMGEEVSVFGRIQNHYCKSGTGSGIHCDFLLLLSLR